MAHFYDDDFDEVLPEPWPENQHARLCIPATLLQSGIDPIVYGDDAMEIVHRVPIVLSDLQMIVPANRLRSAASLICSNYAPFNPMNLPEMNQWREYKSRNQNGNGPFVFDTTGTSTILLHHTVPSRIRGYSYAPDFILLHVPSVYHIDLHDPTRTIFNPDSLDVTFDDIRFPSLPAFIDSIIDTIHEPPSQLYLPRFDSWLQISLEYLDMYTIRSSVKNHYRVLCLVRHSILNQVKEENRPFLSRSLLSLPQLDYYTSAFERKMIKEAWCVREGVQSRLPTLPHAQLSSLGQPPSRIEMIRNINFSRGQNAARITWSCPPEFYRPMSSLLRNIR